MMISLELGPASWRKRNEAHIFELPHRSDLPAYTGFDLGVRDDTAIWLVHHAAAIHVIG
jgi:hypothetical protein